MIQKAMDNFCCLPSQNKIIRWFTEFFFKENVKFAVNNIALYNYLGINEGTVKNVLHKIKQLYTYQSAFTELSTATSD